VNYAEKLNMSLDEVLTRAKKTALKSESESLSNLRKYPEQAHVINREMDVAGLLKQIRGAALTWVALVKCAKLMVDQGNGPVTEEQSHNPVHLPLWAANLVIPIADRAAGLRRYPCFTLAVSPDDLECKPIVLHNVLAAAPERLW
jgi:hypothetical protein